MSWSLVKRGLELFDDNEVAEKNGSKKSEVGGRTHQRSTKKAAKQQKKLRAEKKIHNQLVEKQVANAVEKYKKTAHKDLTKKNLKLLKRLDTKLNAKHSSKIVNYHKSTLEGRITKDEWKQISKKTKKESSGSVFTEEDFAKMNEIWLNINN